MPVRGQSGHDAGGDGLANAERVADGHGDIAHLHPVAVGHADHRQHRAFGFHLEQGQIEPGIGKHDLGLELAAIGQGDEDLISAFDHVIVGDDQAIGADDHARTQRLRHPRLHRGTAEETLHELFVEVARPAINLGGVDVDDRGRGGLDHRGKAEGHLAGARHGAGHVAGVHRRDLR